jgi:hypothetical protein
MFSVRKKENNENTLMCAGSAVIERNVRPIMRKCNLCCHLYLALKVSR